MPHWLPQVLGYALSAACLFWVLRDYPIRRLIPEIRMLDWKWVGLAVAFDLAVYVCHGWRWLLLLRPVARVPFWGTVQAIYVGLFANEVLPLRPGELIRCYLLAHWNDILLSVVFCSAAIERLVDGVWMIACFVVTAHYVRGLPEDLMNVVRATGVVIGVGVVVLTYVVMHKTHAHSMVREGRWAVTLRHIVEGLHTMGNPGTLATVVPVSFLYLLLQVFSYWALMKAFELDLSFWAAAGVMTVVRFGTVIPNAPGNVGLFQAVCFYAMHKLFGIESNDAKTFSFVLFFAQTLPLLVAGAIATALTGLNLGEIHAHARKGWQARHIKPPEEIE